LSDILSLSYQ